jgi:hypothetical protein
MDEDEWNNNTSNVFDEKKFSRNAQLYILLGSVGFEYIDNI